MKHIKHVSAVGHDIVLVQNNFNQGWQGYVGVTREHPLFLKNYNDDIPELKNDDEKKNVEEFIESRGILNIFANMRERPAGVVPLSMQFSVHGGITYSGYSYWNGTIEDVVMDEATTLYVKRMKLLSKTGNELYSHYARLGINIHNYTNPVEGDEWKVKAALANPESVNEHHMFPAAWRVHQVYQALINVPDPERVLLKNGKTTSNYGMLKTGQFKIGPDDIWYFGWDCAHYRDTAAEFTQDRALAECERLSEQLFYYKVLQDEKV